MNNSNRGRISPQEKINTIFHDLVVSAADDIVVRKEKTQKLSSSLGSIGIYDRSQLEQAERSAKKANPLVQYTFYPSVYDSSRIGSVAIYGDRIEKQYATIKRQRCLFGLSILSVKIGVGRRPFIDVCLAARR